MLVLLPLGSMGAFAVVLAGRAADAVASSTAAAEQVQAFGVLSQAASAVDQELVTVVVLASMDNPLAVQRLGITPAFAAAAQGVLAGAVADVRTETDARLAAARDLPDSAEVAAQVQDEVAGVRAWVDGDGALDLTTVRDRWSAVADRLHRAQARMVVSAASQAGSTATVSAIRDVRLLADLSASITPDVVDFLGWQLYEGGVFGGRYSWQWLQSHGAVETARAQLTTISDPAVRRAGLDLSRTPDALDVAAVYDRAMGSTPVSPSITQLQSLIEGVLSVTGETSDVLDRAVGLAAAAAATDGEHADGTRDATMAAAAGAVLLTLVVLGVLGRRMTRSLGRVADAADEISQGRLVDVAERGPREVRSVGRALGAAVGSLRRIQDQAGAVARGDLGDPVLDEAVPGPLGELLHSSVDQLVTSIRQRERLQSALVHQAAHDPLTDLPNRARALDLTTAALHRAQRAGAATGLLFVDLDGFKAVNDRAGHAAGDEVLRTVATRMREEARAGDTVCRLGGDEFVVLVEAVADVGELVALGERLVAAISQSMTVTSPTGARAVAVGASIGVALAQDGQVDGDQLLAQADAAVYRAKHAGRGRVEVFDDQLRSHIEERRDVEVALRRGLADGEVHVLYQPVVEVAGGALVGFEALPRWERPGVGLLSPEAFVPVAEQSDLVCELDRWVLRSAVGQLADWRAAHGLGRDDAGPTVSVNVSARFLGDPRVTDTVLGCLVDAGLPSSCLVLEVAERAVVEAPLLLAHLAALRALGVRVALDDFGTGTTSIGALRHLPVDTLKVDGSFVSADPADQRLVALMVATAHASGLTVVAEGVEHAAVLDRLAADACDAAQGFHLSVPLPAGSAGDLFRAAVSGAPVT
ncbi:diguanylate cyclase (GGDEF) domain-containing protein [Klenkia soli]|uniref:Diguanylate cyclase (GGDEF) domain-containing protein n=1 Tax=Klenkia soli TaxID=1052260 RepID=A0A1H0RRY8_9ACTN|nr:EAL domain-containing protein [Klenkia soli]SDP32227.1 diguanylate cyclase (GGDEF) domain-containing protein [Klenkia soli]